MNAIYIAFGHIGFLGPIMLTLLTIGNLYYNKSNFTLMFFIFYCINNISNSIIKLIFRQRRPSKQLHVYNFEKSKILGQQYGMPSGHAQVCFYCVAVNYHFNSKIILYISLIISSITLAQRYLYRNHTITQLFFGSITGIIIFYISLYIFQTKNNSLLWFH